ncbi:MAG TPA: thiamine phosphate synthase [Gemmatimonadaceae bacterium]|nr:thiamine phosphate synthase [Gemmatimonadaceae bacterium]
MIPVIHAVTDDLVLGRPDFLERARGVMRALGPRGALHLRGHLHPAARIYELAVALRPLQERTGCWVVVNDRVDAALAAGARGAQLTSRSITVGDARRIAPALALGASVHAAGEACVAADAGADWVVAGHVWATPSHEGTPGRGLALVTAVTAAAHVPCIAIGGVRPARMAALLDAGAHGVAAISGIWGASDAERAAIDYLSTYDTHRGG